MPPPTGSIDDQIANLSRRLAEVESRLAAIEGASPPAAAETFAESPPPALRPAFDFLGSLTNLGRSFIILGGAFLLRALTEAGTWPPAVGVSVGLVYALTWLVTSARSAAAGNRLRAIFDGGTALTIGFPLIVEAALKFGLFSPATAAVTLGLFTAGALVSANHGRVPVLAWLATVGGLATGLMLFARTGALAPVAFYFTSLGVATLWLGYLREWRGLRWPSGAMACLAVLGVTIRAISQPPVDSAAVASASQVLLLVAYLGSIAVRTLVRGRQVIVFEVVQTVLVLIVGLGGMIAVGYTAGGGNLLLGGMILGLGAAAYAVSFQFLARHAPGALNFYFYSSLALILVMVGTWTALGGATRVLALTGFGVALAVAWSRSSRAMLGAHTAIALVAAAEDAGLLTLGLAAFTGGLTTAGLPAWPVLVVLSAVVVLSGNRLTEGPGSRLSATDGPGLALGLVALTGLAGMVAPVAAVLANAIALPFSTDLAITINTAVLSLLAVGCARLPRSGRLSQLGRLAYPLLTATGVKLLLVDVRLSQASTLFAGLACYGAALVLVPRLRKMTERP
ncbi:MAG: hypothetical protein Q8O42_14435 [Acidobacteriota bacterium]|nr:hypothetical protein [Acidobacteriota bacterium]